MELVLMCVFVHFYYRNDDYEEYKYYNNNGIQQR